jgi:putative membrane protein insertion efficiency factor
MTPGGRAATRVPVRAVIFVIELYRTYVSPMRLPTCRFIPTCSQYAVEALTEFGLLRGTGFAMVRLAKCGPWHRGGWDPIPESRCTHLDGTHGQEAVDSWDNPTHRRESKSCVI